MYIQKYAIIPVQNRITGKLEEEKVPVYIRLSISCCITSRMPEGGRGLLFPLVFYSLFSFQF